VRLYSYQRPVVKLAFASFIIFRILTVNGCSRFGGFNRWFRWKPQISARFIEDANCVGTASSTTNRCFEERLKLFYFCGCLRGGNQTWAYDRNLNYRRQIMTVIGEWRCAPKREQLRGVSRSDLGGARNPRSAKIDAYIMVIVAPHLSNSL
jgi:hypothetical protein